MYEAIKALEAYGLLTWVHRLKRVRVMVDGLFGPQAVLRPHRTSNGYRLLDPLEHEARKPYKSLAAFPDSARANDDKSENPTGPENQQLKEGKAERATARESCKAADRHRPRPISAAPVPAEPPELLSNESTALATRAPGELLAASTNLCTDLTLENWTRFLAARAAAINQAP